MYIEFKAVSGISNDSDETIKQLNSNKNKWQEWSLNTALETTLRETFAYLSSIPDLVVEVVDIKGVLLFFPKLPTVAALIADCDQHLSPIEVADHFDTHISLNAENFIDYQVIFNSFIEFVMK